MRTPTTKETAMRVVQYLVIKAAMIALVAAVVTYLTNRKSAQQ